MKRRYKILIGFVSIVVVASTIVAWLIATRAEREPSLVAWKADCAGCHGENLEGGQDGPALVGVALKHGDSTEQLIQSIGDGVAGTTMVGWKDKLSPELVKGLALFVSEHRQEFPTIEASYKKVPKGTRTVRSRHHTFVVEKVSTLQSRPYSMAHLPDGRILVSEKIRGLSFIDTQGEQG